MKELNSPETHNVRGIWNELKQKRKKQRHNSGQDSSIILMFHMPRDVRGRPLNTNAKAWERESEQNRDCLD